MAVKQMYTHVHARAPVSLLAQECGKESVLSGISLFTQGFS